MYRARLTSKGQVTIPKDIRDRLGLRKGDDLVFQETPSGYLIQKRVAQSPFDRYVGKLEHLKNHDTNNLVEEMRGS